MTFSIAAMGYLANELIKTFEKREANKQLGRNKCRRENITKGFLNVVWIRLAEDCVRCCKIVSALVYYLFTYTFFFYLSRFKMKASR